MKYSAYLYLYYYQLVCNKSLNGKPSLITLLNFLMLSDKHLPY